MSDLIHKGHRGRMRRKVSENGPRVFDTYELLEMLLYRTVTAKDTNPHSKLLLAEFGSLEGVFLAKREELKRVNGIGDKSAGLIEAVSAALEIAYDDVSRESETFDDYDTLGERLIEYFAGKHKSETVMLSLDNSMRLISIDTVYDLDYSSGGVRPASFMDMAVKRRASVAVIAHNHPFGPICPTDGDLATNVLIRANLANIGVTLVEDYVISGDKYFGFMHHKLDGIFRQRPALKKFVDSKRRSANGD